MSKKIWARIWISIVALALFVAPMAISAATNDVAPQSQVIDLLRLYLMTCAFVGALWAVYLKDHRLRANSDDALVSLFFFVTAATICFATVILSLLQSGGLFPHRTQAFLSWAIGSMAILSLEAYLFAFFPLGKLFMNTYNHMYNLRTNKFIKYFKPVYNIRTAIQPHKGYEFGDDMKAREIQSPNEGLFRFFQDRDLERLGQGASILISGKLTEETIDCVCEWTVERLKSEETVNYVVADRPPIEIWHKLELAGAEKHREHLVLVDAYGPSFGFTDDIHGENQRRLKARGIDCVPAKTFAGLHTASNIAFNIIKDKESRKNLSVRRHTTMVYSHVSALCDLESLEQFRIFWRHVVPSERRYGMLTVIIEDGLARQEVRDFLTTVVDFVLLVDEQSHAREFIRSK